MKQTMNIEASISIDVDRELSDDEVWQAVANCLDAAVNELGDARATMSLSVWSSANGCENGIAKHPELHPGEVFLGNVDEQGWDGISWKSKRRGQVAYNQSGDPIHSSARPHFPVFVQESEVAHVGIKITGA